ncbi:hypothetical protein [Streptomyces aureoversilis]|uniref:Uncharacterized protein n=1 Tax=Streptomyces aureoversilis TaxID=67277 RepID=A0ABV9ZZG0_9ACTN
MRRSQRNDSWWTRVRRSYEQGAGEAGGERPLLGHTVLLGGYAALSASAVGIAGLLLMPVTTRWVAGGMTVISAADLLQIGYDALK